MISVYENAIRVAANLTRKNWRKCIRQHRKTVYSPDLLSNDYHMFGLFEKNISEWFRNGTAVHAFFHN